MILTVAPCSRQGKFVPAQRSLVRACELQAARSVDRRATAAVLYQLATVHLMLGERSQAVAVLEQVVLADNDSPAREASCGAGTFGLSQRWFPLSVFLSAEKVRLRPDAFLPAARALAEALLAQAVRVWRLYPCLRLTFACPRDSVPS